MKWRFWAIAKAACSNMIGITPLPPKFNNHKSQQLNFSFGPL
jgi:hypothetical protein